MLRKVFILDTNILLFDPHSFFQFGNHDVVIPMVVVEEIDRFKRDVSENGRHARLFSRLMDGLRKQGELARGVALPQGGVLTIALGGDDLPVELPMDAVDNRILSLALKLQKENVDRKVVFVTKDINLRIKADVLGILAEDYQGTDREPEALYSGIKTIEVQTQALEAFYQHKKLGLEALGVALKPNQYVILKDPSCSQHTAMARYSQALEAVVSIFKPVEGLWGIFPKNAEQAFAMDALLNDDIKLVSLVGKAGTGKTLLAIAAGLVKTVDAGFYRRLLVSRPVFPLGKDIGFLPGNIEEKLNPWMQPIYDNIDFLFAVMQKGKKRFHGCQELFQQGLLQVEPLTYIRGRSIPQQYFIVDESQNLTPHEIKTIVTRAGDGTKIVLTGDSCQIDNPYVDSVNNGLVYLVDRFQDESIAAHVTLTRGERSVLSELASHLL